MPTLYIYILYSFPTGVFEHQFFPQEYVQGMSVKHGKPSYSRQKNEIYSYEVNTSNILAVATYEWEKALFIRTTGKFPN